jgi:hypothetical protein
MYCHRGRREKRMARFLAIILSLYLVHSCLGQDHTEFEGNNVTEVKFTFRGIPGRDGHQGPPGSPGPPGPPGPSGSPCQLQARVINSTLESDAVNHMRHDIYHELKAMLIAELDKRSNTLGTTRCNPADSCADVAKWRPDGMYWVANNTDGSPHRVYCVLNGHPRCGEGTWMRIGYFNTEESAKCPPTLQHYVNNGTLYCRRDNEYGCSSVHYGSYGHSYREVCGMVEAYQVGGMDAFATSTANSTPDDPYVHGISITHGRSPHRQHIWTYAVGARAKISNIYSTNNCPCVKPGTPVILPTFLGSDYYCDSGNPTDRSRPTKFYSPQLWVPSKGACVSGSECYQNLRQPWFKKVLNHSTTDDVEMRWCAHDQGYNEAAPTKRVEMLLRVK